MADIIFIILFGLGINWVASLHQIYSTSNDVRQKRIVVFLCTIIGIGLGYLATL